MQNNWHSIIICSVFKELSLLKIELLSNFYFCRLFTVTRIYLIRNIRPLQAFFISNFVFNYRFNDTSLAATKSNVTQMAY